MTTTPPLWYRILRMSGHRLAILGVFLLAVGSYVTAPSAIVQHVQQTPFTYDYLAFDTAGALVRQGNAERLYDTPSQRALQAERAGDGKGAQYFVFFYPPATALAFAPLSMMGVVKGYAVFVIADIAAIAVMCWLIHLTLGQVSRAGRWVLAVCVLGSATVTISLLIGQITPFLLLISLGAVALMMRRRVFGGGLLLGLLFIKPHVGLIALLALLASRQRTAAISAAIVAVSLVVVSTLLVGVGGMADYLHASRLAANQPQSLGLSMSSEQNAYGLFATLFAIKGGAALVIVQTVIAASAVTLMAFSIHRSGYTGSDRVLHVAALGASALLVAAPHVQYYDVAFLMFGALFIMHRANALPNPARRLLYGILVLAVFFVETAGMMAGAHLSVSAPFLVLALLLLADWPRLERHLVQAADKWSAPRLRRDDAQPEAALAAA